MLSRIVSRLALFCVCICVCPSGGVSEAAEPADAKSVARLLRESSGIPGGACVVLGGADADLPAAISRSGEFVVQALLSRPAAVTTARKRLRASGEYGQVSADLFGGDGLPYADNLLNLVVVENYPATRAARVSVSEILRVLAPLGVAFLGDSRSTAGAGEPWVEILEAELRASGFSTAPVLTGAGTWVKAVKPWPRDYDEWTHYLHGADGNPVAADRAVGPPRHYQWISEPLWLRSHESDSSIRTMVTARGRLFYIADEAPISLAGDHSLPDKWFLTARDAFNGVLLWKVPITDWGWRAWKPSWFTARPGDIPLNIQKRLVAVGDRVYVTLGYRAPVSQLDAKTGEVLRTYEGTERTGEILYHRGVLVLPVLRDDGVRVMAVDARGGEQLWLTSRSYGGALKDYYKFKTGAGEVTPAVLDPTLNMAADGDVVAFLDGEDILCLDFKTGAEKWRTPFPGVEGDRTAGRMTMAGLWVGTLILQDGVVIHASPNQLAGFSTDSGKVLWTQPKKYIGHLWYEWKDVFVIEGLVWTWSAELEKATLAAKAGATRVQRSTWPVSVNGYDLQTGKLTKKVPLGNIFKTHHHHRCYRNKATVRYIIASRRGAEFVDLKEGKHTVHNWVRGPCHVGMMPANGLQYAPPHPCKCYIDEKLKGMNALAPASRAAHGSVLGKAGGLLERGPALREAKASRAGDEDWPAFRHDPLRSGSVATNLEKKPSLLWRQHVGRKIAPPIVVGDALYVPAVDEHHVVALRVSDGKTLWEFATGGRVDSPPTYYRGTLLFGSADGWVYCVRATDGELLWRFHAAPAERRMAAFGQLESAWPVHGSVLVENDRVYFAAGRSSHLDGGIYLYGLDAESGAIEYQRRLEGPEYDVDNVAENYNLPMGALPDILQGDGTLIYMGNQTFDSTLENQPARRTHTDRVQAMGGFLDDSYFKRMPWSFAGEVGHARLLVHDTRTVFQLRMFDSMRGLDPSVYFTPGQEGYLLLARDRETGKQIWAGRIPVRVNAMVVTEGLLVVAGPPDRVDPEDPLGAFEGRKGGVLCMIDSTSGAILSKYSLESPPVFNGMAAANSRLYVAMEDGNVACFGNE